MSSAGEDAEFAASGSRTLVFAGRNLSPDEFAQWSQVYSAAATALSKREEKV